MTGSDLSSPEDVERFVSDVEGAKEISSLSMIVFDTLARSMSGDENSVQDISRVIKSIDTLRDALDCAVLLIHHSGKDTSRGMRGSNALSGAADSVLRMVRRQQEDDEEEIFVVTVEKQRDAEHGRKLYFRQEKVCPGADPLNLDLPASTVLKRVDVSGL